MNWWKVSVWYKLNLQNDKVHPKNVAAKLCDSDIVTILSSVELLSGVLILRGDEKNLVSTLHNWKLSSEFAYNEYISPLHHATESHNIFGFREWVVVEMRKIALNQIYCAWVLFFGRTHNSQTIS